MYGDTCATTDVDETRLPFHLHRTVSCARSSRGLVLTWKWWEEGSEVWVTSDQRNREMRASSVFQLATNSKATTNKTVRLVQTARSPMALNISLAHRSTLLVSSIFRARDPAVNKLIH